MDKRSDAELIEEASGLETQPSWALTEDELLIVELARRLKAANERLAPFDRWIAAGKEAEEAERVARAARKIAEQAGRFADGEIHDSDDGDK